jgi:hypothetical protein
MIDRNCPRKPPRRFISGLREGWHDKSIKLEASICRRSVLKSVPLIAGAIISTNAMAQDLGETHP